MTKKVPTITSLKSPTQIIVKKTLIIGAAAVGLIAAGAVAFVAVKSSDEDSDVETSE